MGANLLFLPNHHLHPATSSSLDNDHDHGMMTDNPLASNYAMNTALEDFFNFEMLSGPSAGGQSGSSSRSSSNSPSNSFTTLPPTPPNPFDTTITSENSFLEFYLNDDILAKASEPGFLPPTSAAPYDFMGTFPPAGLSSPESGFSTTSPSNGDSPGTIDPQLVDTPSSLSKSHSEFGDEEGDDEDEDGNEDDEDIAIAPVKVGGKGKDRRGTVQSGGIVKKSLDKKDLTGMLSTTSADPDDWRPTPEEYKKMSSKEKRQLRNKISARNFRVRRKGEGLFSKSSCYIILILLFRIHHHTRGRYR